LERLASDDEYRKRFQDDIEGHVNDLDLDEAEREAIRQYDLSSFLQLANATQQGHSGARLHEGMVRNPGIVRTSGIVRNQGAVTDSGSDRL
jgi:arylsulfatase A-like enzyme